MAVAAASVSDESPSGGGKSTLSVTVRNVGARAAAATTLRYYQSDDPTITTSDTEMVTDAVAGLAASKSTSQSLEVTAPVAPGTYYYGACVDAVTDETDTTNNCSAAVAITVQDTAAAHQGQPDLIVSSPYVSHSSPPVGARFTVSASVRNGGRGPSATTTLRYYRSSDGTITTSDTEVGTAEVAELAASGSTTESVELTAPAALGTYYYRACVDSVSDETDTNNNCSTSVQVTVQQTVTEPTEPQGDPDLTVTSAAVSDSGPTVGAKFTLSATVRNGGAGGAETTTLRYYRSADATITAADTEVGTDTITGLAASGSAGQSVELTAPSTPGTYYYGACVDAVTDESDTTNNCSGSVKVAILQPDLVVGAPSASKNDPEAGAQFTLSVTVQNNGEGQSDATTLRYYYSTDTAITTSDTALDTDAIGGLAASGTSSQSVDLTAPSTPGTYYYGACVDAVTDESNATNNCSASVQLTVPQPKPDLVVGAPSVDHSGPAAGAAFMLSATVENDGEGSASATTLRYYQSADATISTSDTEVGADAIGGLAASGTSSQSVDLTAPSTPGTYYYGACVDAVTDESNATNNCSASVQLTVPQPKPDLVVGAPSVDHSGPAAGAAFTLSATVENEGGGAAAATTLRYHRSADATISTSDTSVGTDVIAGLAAARSSSQSVDLTAPETPGTYYYGACVDAVTDESDTTNNCSTSVVVTVPEAEQQGTSVKISAEDDKEWAPVGDTVDLSARVLDEEGEEVTGATVTWSSSNTAVATVNSSGVMTAVGEGTATLIATATVSSSSTQSSTAKSVAARSSVSGGAVVQSEENVSSASIDMEVVRRAARIEITPDSLSFTEAGEGWVGSLKDLTATVYDADDNVMQPTYMVWSSSDEEVVTVRPVGAEGAFVQSIWLGTATVTVTANASATVTVSISVTVTIPSGRVQLSPRSLTFDALGDTKTVTVRIFDEDGEEDEDAWSSYSYFFSLSTGGRIGDGGLDITKVDGGLEITANETGTASVEVFARVHSYALKVTVKQNPHSLEVSPDSASLTVGGTATLTSRVKDSNGHDIQLASGDQEGLVVSWATSNPGVATVDGSTEAETGATATVAAVAAGAATITGSWGSSLTDTATITVTESN